MTLWELLGIRPGVTALIGGGGKTTAMYVLTEELRGRGRVVCCTTTHILPPAHLPVLTEPSSSAAAGALAQYGCVCLGTASPEGKLTAPGIPMARLAALADWVLAEADGSRRLPVKAHAAHEPAIPAEAGRVVLLVGASGFGRPIREVVHRPERFCALTGAAPAEAVTPALAARCIRAEGLGDVVFVNQVETAADLMRAEELAARLDRPVCAGALQKGEWLCLS